MRLLMYCYMLPSNPNCTAHTRCCALPSQHPHAYSYKVSSNRTAAAYTTLAVWCVQLPLTSQGCVCSGMAWCMRPKHQHTTQAATAAATAACSPNSHSRCRSHAQTPSVEPSALMRQPQVAAPHHNSLQVCQILPERLWHSWHRMLCLAMSTSTR